MGAVLVGCKINSAVRPVKNGKKLRHQGMDVEAPRNRDHARMQIAWSTSSRLYGITAGQLSDDSEGT